jgi:hypothetical protein
MMISWVFLFLYFVDTFKKSIAATSTAAHATTSECSLTGEIGVFRHGLLQWVAIARHDGSGEGSAFIGLHPDKLLRACGQACERKAWNERYK